MYDVSIHISNKKFEIPQTGVRCPVKRLRGVRSNGRGFELDDNLPLWERLTSHFRYMLTENKYVYKRYV